MKYPKIMAGVVTGALTLSLGLVGCGGGGGETKTETKTDEPKTETVNVTDEEIEIEEETPAEDEEEEVVEEEEVAEVEAPADAESWGNAWMGISDQGETFYYAESPDGTEGIMVVLNAETNEYVSFVGAVSNVSDTQIQIEDATTGNTLTFSIEAADEDGNVIIDMGEQGEAVLASCTMDEVIEAIATINEHGVPVA